MNRLFLFALVLTGSVFGQNFDALSSFTAASQQINVLYDRFSVSQAAPLTTPRVCDSGLGAWNVIDTANLFNIVSNRLYYTGQGTPAYCNPGLVSTNYYSRLTGRGLFFTCCQIASPGNVYIGWKAPTDVYPQVGPNSVNVAAFSIGWAATSLNTEYKVAHILRGLRGSIVLIKGGAYSDWTLITVYNTPITINTLQACIANYTMNGYVSDVAVMDLDGKWNTEGCLGVALAYDPSPVSGQTTTGAANGTIAVDWTPGTNEVMELWFRQSDPTNRLFMRCTQKGTLVNAGTVVLGKVINGAETTLKTNSIAFLGATEYYVSAFLNGNTIQPLNNGTFMSSITESFNNSATGIGITNITPNTGYTNTDFTMWPKTVSFSPRPTQLRSQITIYCYGDSKTGNTGDSAPWLYGYVPILCQIANAVEPATKVVHGGYKLATGSSCFTNVIDADLVAASNGVPNFVCFNGLVNDNGATNAQLMANLSYVLDAFHAKWPTAKVGVARPWSTGRTMDAWNGVASMISGVIATRPWAVLGPDERVFLENGDNGATYVSDGVHPNHAGYVLTAKAWKATFGL